MKELKKNTAFFLFRATIVKQQKLLNVLKNVFSRKVATLGQNKMSLSLQLLLLPCHNFETQLRKFILYKLANLMNMLGLLFLIL